MRRIITPLTVVGVLLTSTLIWACSVPVFRYALERWPADKYNVVVYHRGDLSPKHKELVSQFDKTGAISQQSANVELRLVDLDAKPAPVDLELWKKQKTESLPLMVVRTPLPAPVPAGYWSGELSEDNVSKMIDSPLRKNIAKQLIDGQTAVWVFLESGQPEKDKAAYALLSKELKRMEKTLKLPEIEEADIEQGLVSVSPDSLKLKFSLEKLSRDDSAETGFTSMLLATEDDLKEFNAEPMAFPVFGRGRVLYALIGKGINSGTIEQACRDLTGPCTCQVKDQNPGTDLLMAVNWENLVTPTTEDEKELPPLTRLIGYSKESDEKAGSLKMPEAFKNKPSQNDSNTSEGSVESQVSAASKSSDNSIRSDSAENAQGSSLFRNLMIMACMMLVVILGASYFLLARK